MDATDFVWLNWVGEFSWISRYYLYDVLTHKGCKMRQVIINQALNLEIIFIAAAWRCQEDTGALHKLLACGLMDTDVQDGPQGSQNPGKIVAISMTHGILLSHIFLEIKMDLSEIVRAIFLL